MEGGRWKYLAVLRSALISCYAYRYRFEFHDIQIFKYSTIHSQVLTAEGCRRCRRCQRCQEQARSVAGRGGGGGAGERMAEAHPHPRKPCIPISCRVSPYVCITISIGASRSRTSKRVASAERKEGRARKSGLGGRPGSGRVVKPDERDAVRETDD